MFLDYTPFIVIREVQYILIVYFIHSSLYPYLASPHFPLPTVTTSLFSVSVNLLLFCYIHWFVVFFRLHIYMIIYSIFLSLTYSTKHNTLKSIHVIANGKISFFFWLSIPLCVYVHIRHIFTHSSVDGLLGCFHMLAVVNHSRSPV